MNVITCKRGSQSRRKVCTLCDPKYRMKHFETEKCRQANKSFIRMNENDHVPDFIHKYFGKAIKKLEEK